MRLPPGHPKMNVDKMCWIKKFIYFKYPNLIHMTIGKTLRKYQHDKDDGKMIDRVRIMGENGMDDGGNSNDKQGDGITKQWNKMMGGQRSYVQP